MSSDGLRNRKSGIQAMGCESEQDLLVLPPPSPLLPDPGCIGDNKRLPDLIEKLQVDIDDVIVEEAEAEEMETVTCGEICPPVEEQVHSFPGPAYTSIPRHECIRTGGWVREREEYSLTQFQPRQDTGIPWKGGLLALFLFLVGIGLFILSAFRMACNEPFLDRVAPLLFLAIIGFIPGSYHTFYFTGGLLQYYSFSDMPQFNFN